MLEAKGDSPVGVVREVPELLRIFCVDVLGSGAKDAEAVLEAGDDSCSGVGEVGEVPEVGHGKLSTIYPELGAVKTGLRVPGRGLRAVSCVSEQEAKKSPAAERVNIGVKGAGVDDGGRSSSRQQAAQRQANTPNFHSKWT